MRCTAIMGGIGGVVLLSVSIAHSEEAVVLESGRHADLDAARATWRPIEGSPHVERADDGRLLLRCPFGTFTNWRAGWDRTGPWELGSATAVEVDLEPSGYVQMVLYLESEGGWYRANFELPAGPATVELPRKGFASEGEPRGWERIRRMRLAVRRSGEEDISVRVGRISAAISRAEVLVYRNDAGKREEGGVDSYVEDMANRLDRIGVPHQIIDDTGVEAGRLAGKRLLILPLNPIVSARAAAALERFVAGGGRMIVCYRLPGPLGRLLGVRRTGTLQGRGGELASLVAPDGSVIAEQDSWIAADVAPLEGTEVLARWGARAGGPPSRPAATRNTSGVFIGHVLTDGDRAAKDRWLMGLVAGLWPGAWRQAYERASGELGRIGGLGGVRELADWVAARPGGGKALVDEALRAFASAERDAAAGRHERALSRLAGCRDLLLRAYATSLPSRRGEFRGIWCHRATGLPDRSWDESVRRLAECGVGAVFPNMLWAGSAAYESDVLPVIPEVKERGDQLAECLRAARRHGVEVHVWKVNWRLWSNTPDAFREKLRAEGRLQANPRGETIDSLCPSNAANFAMERDSMLEVVRRYAVDGIHFDYIRYPGPEGCYCATCRRSFEEREALTVRDWPKDVIDGPLRERYLDFRRANISRLVEAVSRGARAIRPGVRVSAAVFWNLPVDRDLVGQDWGSWLQRGWLDFVCPMTYTTDARSFEWRVARTREWAGPDARVMPGIGASLGQAADDTLRQVLISRRGGAQGFIIFDYNVRMADEVLPLLKLGLTRDAAPARRPGAR